MKEKFSTHHELPRSRFKGGNEVLLPKLFHTAWHELFLNLQGVEIEMFVGEINWRMKTQKKITAKEIVELRERIKALKPGEVFVYLYMNGGVRRDTRSLSRDF